MPPKVTRMAPGEAQTGEVFEASALTIAAEAQGPRQASDLLFVHGMASGGWMWPEAWLAPFAAAGYRCWTVTLPGRPGGASLAQDPATLERILALALQGGNLQAARDQLWKALPGMALLDGPGLSDFAQALEDALAQIGRPTALVAHSLGGAAAQKLLQHRGTRPAATVLLASVPPYGLWRAAGEMALINPDLFAALAEFSMGGMSPQTSAVLRRNFFPSGIADAPFTRFVARLTDESLRAMSEAQGWPPFAPLPGPRPDLMVLGGDRDRLVPVTDLYATAAYYGTLPHLIPGGGHMLMQEPGPDQAAAQAILEFLAARA